VTEKRLPNPALVGKSAPLIAEKCGIAVPGDTRVLIAPLAGVGRDYPLSIEKLCPVLSFYVVRDWREGCERCKEILRYGGMGHTMSIHSRNEQVILEFGLKKPAFRIIVNSPTTHGSIGLTTGLDPAMTLGCGGYGGNITSDNISPRHLLNIKRLAYEIVPAANRFERPATGDGSGVPAASPPVRKAAAGISAGVLTYRIDEFLGARGFRAGASPAPRDPEPEARPLPAAPPPTSAAPPSSMTDTDLPVDFVCEEDVRRAVRAGRTLTLAERAIVTPAARDLGDQHGIFRGSGR
jgi:acetaldehyde dehydrogenase (acetylating)